MTHLDLFSGIGGFALAARSVWGGEHEVVCFCEINKYCQQVLKKHWPDVPICEDIRSLNHEFIANANSMRLQEPRTEQQAEGHRGQFEIDLLTGGFPCQPFSSAGQRRGKEDDRFLWPEMLRVIKEFKPRWIIGENVAGLLSMAQLQGLPDLEGKAGNAYQEGDLFISEGRGLFIEILENLENLGYEVQPFVIPACAVGAPHRRDRIWIVANHNDARNRTPESEVVAHGAQNRQDREQSQPEFNGHDHVKDARCEHGQRAEKPRKSARQICGKENASLLERPIGDVADTKIKRSEQPRGSRTRGSRLQNSNWQQNWLEVATRFCGVDDGLSVELDEFKLSKAQHRVERLKALGNAIVPQVAIEIMQGIREVENELGNIYTTK